jgi:hypothetical protein
LGKLIRELPIRLRGSLSKDSVKHRKLNARRPGGNTERWSKRKSGIDNSSAIKK